VQRLRSGAEALSDELLVVLVGDMVTEEALPNYTLSLNLIAQDYQGTAKAPWARWMRGWTAEENRHGDLLNAFLRLSGRVNMRSVEQTVHHLINNGFNAQADMDMYAGLIYPAFQERATKISHQNVGRLAAQQGDAGLGAICRRIASDEARHEVFYTRMMAAVFDADPELAMQAMRCVLRKQVAMPGRLMDDGQDPQLFDHFAAVAQRLGVYTVQDYAEIVSHLVAAWDIPHRPVTGQAAKAQHYLCHHAEKVNRAADAVIAQVKRQEPVPFRWIHDRRA